MNSFDSKKKQVDFLLKNNDAFFQLSDLEIAKIFDDQNIDPDIKDKFAQTYVKRLRNVPFDLFKNVLFYVNDINLLHHYQDRIDSLSYVEMIDLVYRGHLDADCLVEFGNMEIFKRYLKEEKQNGNSAKLQCFELLSQLYMCDETKELENIGNKMMNLLNSFKNLSNDHSDFLEESDELKVLEFFYSNQFDELKIIKDAYLEKVIEDETLDLDSNIHHIALTMIKQNIKSHKPLTDKMIKFYILRRLRELDLQSVCNNIITISDHSSYFGDYKASNDTLRIFTDYIPTIYRKIAKKLSINNRDSLYDGINLLTLEMISHELYHITKHKEIARFLNQNPTTENLKSTPSLYYWYKNGLLHRHLGEKKYTEMHSQFIEEVRADLFSIFDSSKQISKHFQDAFSSQQLEASSKRNASRIVSFYTEETNLGHQIVMPIDKFDYLFSSYLPEEENTKCIVKPSNDPKVIMTHLLGGEHIEEDMLDRFLKIANGSIVTDNIYQTTLDFIKDFNMTKLESSNTNNIKKTF